MSELGRRLKEERERKQLSLEDLQRETKIQKRYLSAIEEGRFDILPGQFYARAFIKNYAEVLGLDPEQLLQEFSHEIPNPTKEIEEMQIPSRSERSRSRQNIDRKAKRKNSFVTTLVGFAAIIVLFIGIYIVVQAVAGEKSEEITQEDSDTNFEGDFSNDLPKEEEKTADEDAKDEPSVADATDLEEPNEEEKAKKPAQELTFIETVGNRSFYELSSAEQFLVTIEYSGECYVDIKNGKGHVFDSGIKQAGDTQQFDFSEEEEITFNFGASPNVKLKINDEELSLPLNTHVQRITVKFKGV